MVFGQKWPTIGNEWEMKKKEENTEHFCVYNQQIPHHAEKNCTAMKGWNSITSRVQNQHIH